MRWIMMWYGVGVDIFGLKPGKVDAIRFSLLRPLLTALDGLYGLQENWNMP